MKGLESYIQNVPLFHSQSYLTQHSYCLGGGGTTSHELNDRMLNDKLFRINFMNQYFSSNSRSGNGKQGQLSPAVTTNREITFNKETVGKSSQKGMLPLQRWKDSDQKTIH